MTWDALPSRLPPWGRPRRGRRRPRPHLAPRPHRARRGGREGAGQGVPARCRRRAQLLRPLRRPRVQQPAPGHRPSPPRVFRRRREPGRVLRDAPRVRPPPALLQRRPAGLHPRGREPPGHPVALRRPGLPGVGNAGRQADADRLARPGDRADPGHRGDAGRLLLVAARALLPRPGARARGADALGLRPARSQLACRGGDASHGDVPGRQRPRSAPPGSRRSRR